MDTLDTLDDTVARLQNLDLDDGPVMGEAVVAAPVAEAATAPPMIFPFASSAAPAPVAVWQNAPPEAATAVVTEVENTARRRRSANRPAKIVDVYLPDTDGTAGRRTYWGLKGNARLATLRAMVPEWVLPYLPEQVTVERALRRAVDEVCRPSNLFREAHPRGGWAICTKREVGQAATKTLEMGVWFRLYLDKDNAVQAETEGADQTIVDATLAAVRERIETELTQMVDPHQMSGILSEIVLGLGAITVLKKGHYYVPPGTASKWDELVEAFDKANEEGTCPHQIDNSPVMRKDASFFRKLAMEYAIGIEGKLDAMAVELAQGVSGTVIDNRVDTLVEMADGVRKWAKIMQTSPDALLTRIEGLKAGFLSADNREATERRSSLLEVG